MWLRLYVIGGVIVVIWLCHPLAHSNCRQEHTLISSAAPRIAWRLHACISLMIRVSTAVPPKSWCMVQQLNRLMMLLMLHWHQSSCAARASGSS